jgi:ABC-type Fe3+-hydroxamate transport system substrate-binding protein
MPTASVPAPRLAALLRRAGLLAAGLVALLLAAGADAATPRIVTLNPSLTAIVLALDAAETLVGVDDWSARQQPGMADRPTVGGLFDPNLEAIVALRPDVVAMVPGAQQQGVAERLQGLGIQVLELPNIRLEELLDSIEVLGRVVGRPEAAAARTAAIRAAWARAERQARGRPRPRTVLVLQRDPLFLVGRGSFLDAMLTAAGAENLGAELAEAYPRASLEWLLAAGPEVILDASEGGEDAPAYWQRWPSLPAVRSGRVVALPAERVTLPGPHLDRGLGVVSEALARPGRAP